MQFTSLKVKLICLLSGCFILLIGALLAVTMYFSTETALENARTITKQTAEEQAMLVDQQFDAGFVAGRTLRDSLLAGKQFEAPPTREDVLKIVHEILTSTPEFYGIWTAWEPNALDGKDALYKGDTRHSSDTGQFAPYWSRSNGTLSVRTCGNIGGSWYTYSRDTKLERATNVTEYTETDGSKFRVTSLTLPIVVNSVSVGAIGVDLSAGFLQNIADNVSAFDGNCQLGIIAPDGTVQTLTAQPDILGTPYAKLVHDGDSLLEKAARNGAALSEDNETLRVVIPVIFGNSDKPWFVSLSVPMDIVMAKANAMLQTLAITGGIGLLIALAALYYIAVLISRPIVATSDVITSIADGDLTARCVSSGKDEIATMQGAVNAMATTLQKNMEEIEENMEEVRIRSKEAEIATEKAVQAEAEAVEAHRDGKLAAAKQLEVFVADLTKVSAELDTHIRTTAEGVGQQDVRNSETATAMEEMNSTILEVAKNASEAAASVDMVYTEAQSGIEVIDHSVTTIQNVHSLSEHLTSEMGNLETQVDSISEILNVITDIADQTNLLALNAAIEAARAGDAGRGFAVVADEVRKLAEKTMEATNKVGTAIQNIQTGTQQNIDAMTKTASAVDEATKYVSESGEAFERIVSKVTPATDQVRAIATAAEQQSSASEQITHAVEEISHISSITASKMTEAEHAVETLGKVSDALQDMMHTLQQG
ncbi:MAG: methyl-accepting chemotaxis protein [Desulfovibrionales bacterium]|nr:methyl-accepting chemotaxis protein [Desulfovibrionales bacterium]